MFHVEHTERHCLIVSRETSTREWWALNPAQQMNRKSYGHCFTWNMKIGQRDNLWISLGISPENPVNRLWINRKVTDTGKLLSLDSRICLSKSIRHGCDTWRIKLRPLASLPWCPPASLESKTTPKNDSLAAGAWTPSKLKQVCIASQQYHPWTSKE